MTEFEQTIRVFYRELHRISMDIHENPELGFCEFRAAEKLTDFLREHGCSVETGTGGLETAFRTEYGTGKNAFLFVAEYDALKGLGHACGHNLICSASAAAFLAASQYLKTHKLAGKLVLIGTPAEEIYGGKIKLDEQHIFDGCSASVMAHPYRMTAMDPGWLSAVKYKVRFTGKAAHAAANPEQGLNALDAAVSMYQALALWRQQLPESARIHCIISDGGSSPNVIPEHAELFCYLRSSSASGTENMKKRFRTIARASALSCGTRVKIIPVSEYPPTVFNTPLNDLYAGLWKKNYGEKIIHSRGLEGRASTDYGVISGKMPGACFLFDAAQEKVHPLHTPEFRRDAASAYAFERAMQTAAIMAEIAVRYLTDTTFRKSVDEDFRKRTQDI